MNKIHRFFSTFKIRLLFICSPDTLIHTHLCWTIIMHITMIKMMMMCAVLGNCIHMVQINQSINHFFNAMYVQIKAIQQRLWWWWILFNTNHKFNSIRFQYYSYTLTYNKFFFWTSEIVSKINVKKMKIVRNTLYNFVSFCLFLFVCSL